LIFIKLINNLLGGKATGKPCKPGKRYYHSATLIGDSIYYFGGKDFAVRINELYKYDIMKHSGKIVNASGL
jgi:hypothetical protein